ncbi:hypothetical protein PMPD1_4396 (plasmid) [Paramixta manurensis]|uniref:Uncharacterized protein n=1 Tax=Paramixta manurensis TaxID=2740817 RepID=A0A6M8UI59_9GAMM|nr:hypothetical protein PMPD1_4396 [Erwiniaceae bacterium PD-1]
MLTLSPLWHGRLRSAHSLTNLLLQTFVIHPALLFFMLFLLGAHNTGGAGQMILNEADKLVRDAPPGSVWACVQQATRGTTFPTVPLKSLRDDAPVSSDLRTAPPSNLCVKAPQNRADWVNEFNSTLLLLYKVGVTLSLLAHGIVWSIRRRA